MSGELLGYAVEVPAIGTYVTVCLECFEEGEDSNPARIEDQEVFGEDVPYPECNRCGEVIRP